VVVESINESRQLLLAVVDSWIAKPLRSYMGVPGAACMLAGMCALKRTPEVAVNDTVETRSPVRKDLPLPNKLHWESEVSVGVIACGCGMIVS